MHSTTIAAAAAAMFIASASAFTASFGTYGTLTVAVPTSEVASKIRQEISSQETESAFAAEIKTLPGAKGHNIPSDVASLAVQVMANPSDSRFPQWLSAAPTTGPVYSAVNNDISDAEFSLIAVASKSRVDAKSASSAGATKDAAAKSTSTGTETKTTTSGSSTGTSTTTSTSTSSTSTSKGGAVGQPTGAVMAAGAAAAGVLGLAVML